MNEFKNDPMMRRLHDFRRRDYKATKNLPFAEIERRRDKRINKNLEEIGYRLVDLGDGTSKMVRIKGKS